jgi:hypothetical protein
MGGGSTKQCGALFCLTFCRLFYLIRKDKTAKAKTFVARGSSVEKVHHKLQNFNGLGLMRFPFLFAVGSNTPPFRAVKFGNANKKW